MDKTCGEQDVLASGSEPLDVKESVVTAVRSSVHSSSSNRSKTSSTPTTTTESDADKLPLKLVSPIGGEAFIFYWPLREMDGYSEGQEILELVKEALSSFPEVDFIVRQKCALNTIDKRNLEQMSSLMETFNKTVGTISQLWKGATKPGSEVWSAERAEAGLLKHICARAYNRAVDNVHQLNNHYKAFSSQTYGETSFERMQMIIEEIVPKERDVFVDLGSGVGQLVIHMAGGSKVRKAVGIEVAPLPCKYANKLGEEFKRWMKWYGKKFRPFELLEGNFLSEQYRDLITKEATVIFINNYAFSAMLESRIKRELLSELKDGTRIISTKPYGTPNRSITNNRQLNDISAILDVHEMVQCENACSWTSNYVPYFYHTINRAKLEKYFLAQRNPELRVEGSEGGSRRSSTSSKASRGSAPGSSNGSRESSVSLPPRRSDTPTKAVVKKSPPLRKTPPVRHSSPSVRPQSQVVVQTQAVVANKSDDDDDHAIGPTTRRKWQEYCTKTKVDTKTQMQSTVSSTEDDPGDIVRKWPTPDTEYLPPSAKKKRTGGARGRPRKNQAQPKALREETKEAIDLMHQMTRTATARPNSPVHEPSLVLADLSAPPKQPVAPPAGPDNAQEDLETLHCSKYPALNLLLEWLRKCYEAQIDIMVRPEYVERITGQIDSLRIQQTAMHARIDSLAKQISQLLATGVGSLYARLDELDIDANTPSLLLENAKDIVARHKKITAECASLENEITGLDLSNQELELRKRRKEETAAQLFGVSQSSLAIAENYHALESQNKSLMNRMAALAAKMEVLPGQVETVGQVNPASMVAQVQQQPTAQTQLQQIGLTEAQLAAVTTSAVLDGNYRIEPGATVQRGTLSSQQQQTPVTSTAASLLTNPLKRARSRTARQTPTNKRFPSTSGKLPPSDPKEEEEMERKIQDIVAKALEVDSAAKCAEKERRARGEKRKEKTTLGMTPTMLGVGTGTQRRSDELVGDQRSLLMPGITQRSGIPVSVSVSVPDIVSGTLLAANRATAQQYEQGLGVGLGLGLGQAVDVETTRSDED